MNITITVSDDVGRQLISRASNEGKDITAFVTQIAEREAKKPTLDEVLAPVRQRFLETGMSEDDLTQLVKEERRKMRQERERTVS